MQTLRICLPLVLVTVYASTAQANVVTHGSFETPDIGTSSFAYNINAAGGAWTFTGNAGLIDPPSGFGAPSAPDGSQIGFLQAEPSSSSNFGAFSQTVNLSATGTYFLSYQDAGRFSGTGGNGNLSYEILLDSTVIVDNVATTTSQPFTARQFQFPATAGSYTLTFRVDPTQTLGSDAAFFDQVSVSIPEPPSILLLGLVGCLCGIRYLTDRIWFWCGQKALSQAT